MAATVKPAKPPQDKVNILVVDDQPAKLVSYEAVLSELDENIIKASSARTAFEVLLKNDIAVILVDVCMPELNGFELAQMIREHPRFKDIAIVFVSAIQIDDLDRLRGYQLGAVDYIPVPIIPDLLRAKVKLFAELHRKTRQLERFNRVLEDRVQQRTEELQEANARLQLVIDVAGVGTWERDFKNNVVRWSDRCFELLGYAPGEVTPSDETWLRHIHAEDRERVRLSFTQSAAEGGPFQEIYRSLAKDGTIIWCEARAHHERDAEGAPQRAIGVIVDITQHKAAEERQRLMVQELHHRVKNSLATVQAIASLTSRASTDVKSFYAAFSSRIESLSRTHTLLVTHNWARIRITDLLAAELSSFQDREEKRVVYSGPGIHLPSDTALSLGLVFHELTTNAVKYGSLSTPGGRLDVRWTLENSEDAARLELEWIESGGPPVAEPQRRGFGTTLLRKIFAAQAGARLEMSYEPKGFEFRLSLPIQTARTPTAA